MVALSYGSIEWAGHHHKQMKAVVMGLQEGSQPQSIIIIMNCQLYRYFAILLNESKDSVHLDGVLVWC